MIKLNKFFLIVLVFILVPNFSFASQSGIRSYRIGNQATATGVEVVVGLNWEDFDLLEEFDTATYRFTASQSGYYSVFASVHWATSIDIKRHNIKIEKVGLAIDQTSVWSSGTGAFTQKLANIVYLTSGEWLELRATQFTGGAVNISGLQNATYLDVWKIDEIGGGGEVAWGEITGILSNQTDLQEALDDLTMPVELIQNTETGAEFYLNETISYGDILILTFLTLFLILGIVEFLTSFLIPKLVNFKRK